MKNAIKRVVIAELTKQSPNSKEIYMALIERYPEFAEDIIRLARAYGIIIEKGENDKEK